VKEERKEKEGGGKKEGKVCQTLGLLVAGAKHHHHHHHLSIYIQYLTVVQKKKPGANQGKGSTELTLHIRYGYILYNALVSATFFACLLAYLLTYLLLSL